MHRTLLAAWAAVVIGLLAGCAQPASRADRRESSAPVVEGQFGDLPRFPRSEAVGPPSSSDTSVAQTFRADDATPQTILEFYLDALVEWEVVDRPASGPRGRLRGVWAREQFELVVTAGAPGPRDYHLELRAP